VTYTYEGAGESDKDTIRFLVGDTDPRDADEWQVTDEEIQWAYDTWYPVEGSLYYVAAVVAETIAAQYAREASYSADGVSVSLGPVGDQYRRLAVQLRQADKDFSVGAGVDVGGMAPDEQLLPGTKPFAFGKGLHDNIEAGPQEFGGVYPPDQAIQVYGVPEYEQIVEP
jgi:hypothetical protein